MSYFVEHIRWYQQGNESVQDYKEHITSQIVKAYNSTRRPARIYLIHHLILLLAIPFIPRFAPHYLVLDQKYLLITSIEAEASRKRQELTDALTLYHSLDPVQNWQRRSELRRHILPNLSIAIANILGSASIQKHIIDESLRYVAPAYFDLFSHVRVSSRNILRTCQFEQQFTLKFACYEVIGERLYDTFLVLNRVLNLNASQHPGVIQYIVNRFAHILPAELLALLQHKLEASVNCTESSVRLFIFKSANCEYYRMLQQLNAGSLSLPWLN